MIRSERQRSIPADTLHDSAGSGAPRDTFPRVQRFSTRAWLATITGFALAIRAAVLIWFCTGQRAAETLDNLVHRSELVHIAFSLATGKGFASPFITATGPTAWTPPIYPFLVSLVLRGFHGYTLGAAAAVLGMSCILSALVCVPLFALGREIGGEELGRAAAIGWAIFPYAIHLSTSSYWDFSLSALLMTLIVLIAYRIRRSPSMWLWLLWGATIGCAGLTNPVVVTVVPFVAVWLAWELTRAKLRWMAQLSLAAFVAAVLVTPWLVRDYKVFGEFIPIRSNFWLELRVGNQSDPNVDWAGWLHPIINSEQFHLYEQLGEKNYMNLKRSEALAWIQENPGTYLMRIFKRFAVTWTGIFDLRPRGEELANIPFCTILTLVSFGGLWIALRKDIRAAVPLAIVLAVFPVLYYFTNSNERYRHPIDPLMVLLAAYAFIEYRRRKSGTVPDLKAVSARSN